MIWSDDRLPVDEPGNPLPELPEGFRDRLWQRWQEELRRDRRRRRVLRGGASAAVAVVIAGYGAVWYRGAQPPIVGSAPPVAAAHVWPAAAVSVPVSAPRASAPHSSTMETAANPATVKRKGKEGETVTVIAGDTTATTETFPAPPPQVMPWRPPVELARQPMDSNGQPVAPPEQPRAFYRPGLRHPPLAAPGTPRFQDHVTVTPPATTAPPTTTTAKPDDSSKKER